MWMWRGAPREMKLIGGGGWGERVRRGVPKRCRGFPENYRRLGGFPEKCSGLGVFQRSVEDEGVPENCRGLLHY